MNNRAYVIGGNHHNTLGVIRSLGYKGIKSILILTGITKRPYVTYSKYIDRVIKVDGDEQLLCTLVCEGKKLYSRAVLICCSDSSASFVDFNRNTLIDYYHLPGIKEQGRLTYFMNKDTMTKLAEKVGFVTPQSWVLEKNSNICNDSRKL